MQCFQTAATERTAKHEQHDAREGYEEPQGDRLCLAPSRPAQTGTEEPSCAGEPKAGGQPGSFRSGYGSYTINSRMA